MPWSTWMDILVSEEPVVRRLALRGPCRTCREHVSTCSQISEITNGLPHALAGLVREVS